MRFQRSNYVVRDIEKSLSLYRDVIGFKVDFILPPNDESYSYEVFDIPKNAILRFCVLSTQTQERVMALTEITGIELDALQHPRRSAIVLEAANFDEMVEGVKSLGLSIYKEEVLKAKDGRIGRELGFTDYDDNLIVIYKIN